MQPKMRTAMATIVAMNAMIGASIFTVPAQLGLAVGPAVIVSYLLVAALVIFIALAFARVSTYWPSSSPFLTHASVWGGKVAGYISTFLYIFGLAMALGLFARRAGEYMQPYLHVSTTGCTLFSTWAFVFLGFFGPAVMHITQYLLIVFTILPMVVIALLCARHFSWSNVIPFAPHGVKSVLLNMQVVLFGFFGFETIPALTDQLEEPKRTIPRAIILAVLFTGLVYIFFIGSIMTGVPSNVFTSEQMPLSQMLGALYPNATWLGWVIDWAIIVTIWGTIYSMLLAVASLLKNLVGISSKWSLIILGVALTASSLFLTGGVLFSIVALAICASYGMSVLALFFKKDRTTMDLLLGTFGMSAVLFICYYAAKGLVFTLMGI